MHIAWPCFNSIALKLFTYLSCGDETEVDQFSIESRNCLYIEKLDLRDHFQERIHYLCLFEALADSREWAHLNFSRNCLKDMGLTEIGIRWKENKLIRKHSNRTARWTEQMLAAHLCLFQMLYFLIFFYNCHKIMRHRSISWAFNIEIVFSSNTVITAIPFK